MVVGQHVNVLSATELFTFKWLILCELHLKEVLPPPGRGIPKSDFWQYFRNQGWRVCSGLSHMPGQRCTDPHLGFSLGWFLGSTLQGRRVPGCPEFIHHCACSHSAVNSTGSVSPLGDYALRSEMDPHSFFPPAQGLIFPRLLLHSC